MSQSISPQKASPPNHTTMSNIDEIIRQITASKAEIQKLQDELSEKTKKLFHDGMKELFEQCPEVDCVHFTAYSPFFNDGEECTFSCHASDCGFNGYDYAGDVDSLVESRFEIDPTVDILLKARETIYVSKPNPNYVPNSRTWISNNYETISESVPNPDYDVRYLKIKDAFQSLLSSIDDDTWQAMIGNHVVVLIDREGMKVGEYIDHS